MQDKLKQYFATHPEATEVYVARGVLFVNIKNATAFANAVPGENVTTYVKEEIENHAPPPPPPPPPPAPAPEVKKEDAPAAEVKKEDAPAETTTDKKADTKKASK